MNWLSTPYRNINMTSSHITKNAWLQKMAMAQADLLNTITNVLSLSLNKHDVLSYDRYDTISTIIYMKCDEIREWCTTKLWEYTVFGSLIGPLHQRTPDCLNIVLNDECHHLTRALRRFPLGRLGTEIIAHAGTHTVHIEIHRCARRKSLNVRVTNKLTFNEQWYFM